MLESVLKILPIVGFFGALCAWILARIEKRAIAKEQAIEKAKEIDDKLFHLQANYGRITEELQEVRKDFGDLIKQLLLKK